MCQSSVAFGTTSHLFQRDVGLWKITSGECFVFSAMLGSSVDTVFSAVCGALATPHTWQPLDRRKQTVKQPEKRIPVCLK